MTDKPFKTITEQIEILRSRNLTFIDEITSAQRLAANGYYEIINGYKTTFLSEDGENFKDGTTFEDVFALYYFDTKVRTSVMSSIDFIESFLKQKLAYLLAEKHGEMFDDYVSKYIFSTGHNLPIKHRNEKLGLFTDRDVLFKKFNESAHRSYDPFKHYRIKHNNIPPWILVKNLDFGSLRMAITLLNKEDKHVLIARIFTADTISTLTPEQLNTLFSELIVIIHKYRNRAAHGGRMYNYFPDKGFTFLPLLHNDSGVTQTAIKKSKKHSSSIYIMSTALSLLQSNFSHAILSDGISDALAGYSNKWPEQVPLVLKEMEFPNSYNFVQNKIY